MQDQIERLLENELHRQLAHNPAVVLLGPRQCGKTTLARMALARYPRVAYLDLENPSDAARLRDPLAYFALHPDTLICLDEIQRAPELFAVLRGYIDREERTGMFLLLGSASRDLLQQSSETLAGRISYLELGPFLADEIPSSGPQDENRLWVRGGFPRSFLAADEQASVDWRRNFVQTFLERDIGALGFRIPPARLGRLWRMCAHLHGGLLNASRLAGSLGVTAPTARSYVDILNGTFMLRTLGPLEANLGKRLVKSPRIYVRDSGILHSLLGIDTHEELLGHPTLGSSYEGFVIENLIAHARGWAPSFYRTAAGAELDLVLQKANRKLAFEIKASSTPAVQRGFWNAVEDLQPEEVCVIGPVEEPYPLTQDIMVRPLMDALRRLAEWTS